MHYRLAPLYVAVLASTAGAQTAVLVADRTNDAIWKLTDANGNGVIDEPTEVSLFFNASNAAGTPGPLNPNTIVPHANGTVVFGDQDDATRHLVWMRDANCDGDALDAGESGVLVDRNNASGVSFAFPTGAAFDGNGRLFVTNAGNGFGADGIYALTDLDNDGMSQSAGEVADWVAAGAFGAGNGPYSPQEVLFTPNGWGYLRNSSANLHGVYRFRDLDNDGRADGPGEFTLYFGAGNASGLALSAGFALEGSADGAILWMHNLATGSVDQIIRLIDLTGDGDAMDESEAVVAWSTGEASFTSVDVARLPDGTLLISDNSGNRVVALRDLDGDGLFIAPGERSDYLSNTSGTLAAARAMCIYTELPCCDADLNCDGSPDQGDVACIILAVAGDTSCICQDPDFNLDGSADQGDVAAVIGVVAGSPCP